ncbi:MAG: FHA domain-containing protein [Muribaculaceae bacterium]|nr:FHA domain-containing protein [Muribaculaceae bacterium]
MKIISIGRNGDNDIVINDNMISRRHAVIRISPFGKYEIISYGSNGTKVNGNQIVPNQPYPIKRGDSVTFANVSNLNWKRVPDPLRPYQMGGIAVIALAIIICGCFFIPAWFPSGQRSIDNAPDEEQEVAVRGGVLRDSLKQDITKGIKEKEIKELPDFQFRPEKKKDKKKKEEKEKDKEDKNDPGDLSNGSGNSSSQPDDEKISNRY